MVAFIQEQVVNQFYWLTQQEFIDGLALGQFTPGPILMVVAYVGYKVAGLGRPQSLPPRASCRRSS
jgi:chromate transporter